MEPTVTGFDAVTSALNTNVTASTILDPVVKLLPWVGAMVAVAFGIYLIRRAVKKISKGKAGM